MKIICGYAKDHPKGTPAQPFDGDSVDIFYLVTAAVLTLAVFHGPPDQPMVFLLLLTEEFDEFMEDSKMDKASKEAAVKQKTSKKSNLEL